MGLLQKHPSKVLFYTERVWHAVIDAFNATSPPLASQKLVLLLAAL